MFFIQFTPSTQIWSVIFTPATLSGLWSISQMQWATNTCCKINTP
jgi:hypothetical protein